MPKTTTDPNAADSASTKAYRTPAFRCWLCRSRLAPKDYHYLLRWERPRESAARPVSPDTRPGTSCTGWAAGQHWQPYWDEIISVLLKKFNEPKLERLLTMKIYR
jgi:hypothetical protein